VWTPARRDCLVRTVNDKRMRSSSCRRDADPGAKIHDDRLPFDIEVLDYMALGDGPAQERLWPTGEQWGSASARSPSRRTEVSGVDPNQMHDVPSAYVRLTRDGKDEGTWLLSVWYTDSYFNLVQEITLGDKKYQISLRYKQTTRPYSVHLYKVTQDFYPGTEKPKDFASFVRVTDPAHHVDRDVQIYMNAPMFYQGRAFFQASVTSNPQTRKPVGTVLQVVKNPGWLMPYLSCLIVGLAFSCILASPFTSFSIGGSSDDTNNLHKYLPHIAVGIAVLYVGFPDVAARRCGQRIPLFTISALLPVLDGGRYKPMDTVARNNLMIITHRQAYYDADTGEYHSAKQVAA